MIAVQHNTVALRYSIRMIWLCVLHMTQTLEKQVAQLSQRDRAAEWVSYRQKWKTGTGRQYLCAVYYARRQNHNQIFMDIIGLYSITATYLASKEIEIGEKTQNKGYYAVQGHPRSSRSVPIESPYATSY